MPKLFLLFFGFFLVPFLGNSQYNNNYWCFGDSTGIDWTISSSPTFFASSIKGRGSCVSLADSNGLLVYAQTNYSNQIFDLCRLFNKYNKFVANTDSIVGEGWYHELLLLPLPGSDSLAYFFSIGVTVPQIFGLYYSIVDFKANNDSGLVIVKNAQLLNFPAVDALVSIKHGNGRDWWIVFQRWDNINISPNHNYYIYNLSPTGLLGPFIQSIGLSHTTNTGCIQFNFDGSKFASCNARGLITLCDFDRCTGIISNPVSIEQEHISAPYPPYRSCAFSNDGSRLYVTSREQNIGYTDVLYQFDLTVPNITASKQLIYSLPDVNKGMSGIKLAPDNKIYVTCADESLVIPYPDTFYTQYNTYLSVINQPDSLGLACDFQPFSFYLGGNRTYYGLPNNPDYELGPIVGSPCDTLTAIKDIKTEQAFFQAWFKGDWNTLFVNATKLKGKNALVRIFDSTGRLIKEQKGQVYSGYFTADVVLENLAGGVYIVQLVTEKEKLSCKFVY